MVFPEVDYLKRNLSAESSILLRRKGRENPTNGWKVHQIGQSPITPVRTESKTPKSLDLTIKPKNTWWPKSSNLTIKHNKENLAHQIGLSLAQALKTQNLNYKTVSFETQPSD